MQAMDTSGTGGDNSNNNKNSTGRDKDQALEEKKSTDGKEAKAEDKSGNNGDSFVRPSMPKPATTTTILCSSKNNPFFARTLHPLLSHRDNAFWCQPTTIHCWYSGARFPNNPYPMPTQYDYALGKYTTWGVYCSLTCVKSHITKLGGAFLGQRLELLTMMAADVYNYHGAIPTIDCYRFKHFGGDLDHDEWLRNGGVVPILQMRAPPFVDQPLVLEEQFRDQELSKMTLKMKGATAAASGAAAAAAAGAAGAPGPGAASQIDLSSLDLNFDLLGNEGVAGSTAAQQKANKKKRRTPKPRKRKASSDPGQLDDDDIEGEGEEQEAGDPEGDADDDDDQRMMPPPQARTGKRGGGTKGVSGKLSKAKSQGGRAKERAAADPESAALLAKADEPRMQSLMDLIKINSPD